MKSKSRKVTNHILEMIDDGALDIDVVLNAAFSYMSEREVADMAFENGFVDEDEFDDALDDVGFDEDEDEDAEEEEEEDPDGEEFKLYRR